MISSFVVFMHSLSEQIMIHHRDWDALLSKGFVNWGDLKDHDGHGGTSPKTKIIGNNHGLLSSTKCIF